MRELTTEITLQDIYEKEVTLKLRKVLSHYYMEYVQRAFIDHVEVREDKEKMKENIGKIRGWVINERNNRILESIVETWAYKDGGVIEEQPTPENIKKRFMSKEYRKLDEVVNKIFEENSVDDEKKKDSANNSGSASQ